MEQRVLTINHGKKKIISKPWDFEAMCLVDDEKRKGKAGALRSGAEAVYYLFEGTEATEEVLKKLNPSALGKLCLQINRWYMSDLAEALKNG